MRITGMKLYRFSLPLVGPLALNDTTIAARTGLLIELTDEAGNTGLGEASPLPGFSHENLDRATESLRTLRFRILGATVPDHLEELSGGFDHWLEDFDLSSSARFGFESAVLNLLAASGQVPLRQVICHTPRQTVSVNALLTGTPDHVSESAAAAVHTGYQAVKLKVGRESIESDITLTRAVRKRIGDDILLRLDANRAWSLDEAQRFADGVSDCSIEYIEEPVHCYTDLCRLCKDDRWSIPLALDESLRELTPESLEPLLHVSAIVLKPTLLGLERALRFSRRATGLAIGSVLSAAFESGVGTTILAELAACFSPDVPCGLDTVGLMKEDLLADRLNLHRGCIELPRRPLTLADLRQEHLEELPDGDH